MYVSQNSRFSPHQGPGKVIHKPNPVEEIQILMNIPHTVVASVGCDPFVSIGVYYASTL